MSDIVRYAMIGCGMMGQEHLHNLAMIPGAQVTAIFEPDAAMREAAAKLAPDARMVASIADLLAEPALDALIIVSPNFRHLEQLEQIAATRPLPVLVEKPLFTNPADADRIAAFSDRYPAPVWVAMEYRYMPPVARMIAEVDAATGGPRMVTIREHRYPFLQKVGNWNRFNKNSGGTFVEKCCHFFDLMRLILKSDPVRVMASAGQAVNHLDESYDGAVPDILDNGYVIVDFANGTRAMLELCMFAEGSRFEEEISVVGSAGKIEALVPGPGRFWPQELGEPPVGQVVVSPRDPRHAHTIEIPVDPRLLAAGNHNGSTFYEHQRFNAVVRGMAKPDVTMTDGWWAVIMGQAAQESARTGQAVAL